MHEAWAAFLRRDPVHFCGIGGVGMAGLARLCLQAGLSVFGSDSTPNALTRALAAQGAHIPPRQGQVPPGACWVVRTPAVPDTHPELQQAAARGLPVIARGEFLAAYTRTRNTIAVAGAHGKTTTTAMLAHLLRTCGVPCGYAVGGETALPGAVADAGTCRLFVCEADESDGTLVSYAPDIGLVTHVEWDHVDHFATPEDLDAVYAQFLHASRTRIVWAEDERACRLAPEALRFGTSAAADLCIVHRCDHEQGQDVELRWRDQTLSLRLALPGAHNARNAAAALLAALCCEVNPIDGANALASFRSVGRRFERCEVKGVTVIADYAHHPTEIRCLLDAVQALKPRRVFALFQPHRYSRTLHLLQGFADALEPVDVLGLLPVYAASEPELPGGRSEDLVRAFSRRGRAVALYADPKEAYARLTTGMEAGDLLLLIGAGDIHHLFEHLAGTCHHAETT